MTIYTKKGDDGTTGLLYGGRVAKDAAAPTAYGEVDEAQAFLGVVRAQADRELAGIVLGLQRDLWVVMAELATAVDNVAKLTEGQSRATEAMVEALATMIDEISDRFEPPTEFVVPGESAVAAALDVARTVVRRAERAAVTARRGP
ncbi:MAG: cob(I)yrinic acid a,c-diamide adenosyltransferase, partial [Acidimicrobiales bacterium]